MTLAIYMMRCRVAQCMLNAVNMTRAWSKCVDVTVKFVKVFRQKHAAFIRVLNQIREGVVTEEAKALLGTCALQRALGGAEGVRALV